MTGPEPSTGGDAAVPGATVALGAKDLRLLREAAASRGTTLSLAESLAGIFDEAIATGLGGMDWGGGQYEMARRRSHLTE